MESSLRIVPAASAKSTSLQDTANSFGLHDTLQHGPRSFAAELTSTGTIRDRLDNWAETQDNLHLNLQRQLYGLHMPVRLLMERSLVADDPHMPAFRHSNVHLDILMGRDESIVPADFMMPSTEMAQPQSIHADMERKLRM